MLSDARKSGFHSAFVIFGVLPCGKDLGPREFLQWEKDPLSSTRLLFINFCISHASSTLHKFGVLKSFLQISQVKVSH